MTMKESNTEVLPHIVNWKSNNMMFDEEEPQMCVHRATTSYATKFLHIHHDDTIACYIVQNVWYT